MPPFTPSRFFPPAESADEEGLVCVGGHLSVPWLLDAYGHGIFPWPLGPTDPVPLWWSPEPRAIIELNRFHMSRRLVRTCRSGRFRLTCNRDFSGVIHGCASAQDRRHGTWINRPMIDAYTRLHSRGFAHSVETWHQGQLAGGVYGVAIGGLFAAESMFYEQRDASKVALAGLITHLIRRGYVLFDVQQWTEHTATMGAIEISRAEYLDRLAEAVRLDVSFGCKLETSEKTRASGA